MELTEQLGQEIINRLSNYIDVPINLMNPSGKIVASTDTTRIHQLHGGAQAVIHSTEPQMITNADAEYFSNTKPGVNLPIFHRGVLAGVVGLTGDPAQVMQAAGMTQGSVEIALEQIYLQRQAFFQERQWNHWLQQLLHPLEVDTVILQQEAAYTLHINVNQTWQVAVYQTQDPFELAEQLRPELKKYNPLFVLPYQDNEVIVPLPYKNSSNHLPPIEGLHIGIGEPGYAIEGLRHSYKQAKQAISLCKKTQGLHYSESLQMERLLFHIKDDVFHEITDLSRRKLEEMGTPYKETLLTFFSNDLKMNRTAEELHIHRNTLIYRLDRLKRKVGLDPRVWKEAIILQAILIKD